MNCVISVADLFYLKVKLLYYQFYSSFISLFFLNFQLFCSLYLLISFYLFFILQVNLPFMQIFILKINSLIKFPSITILVFLHVQH